MAIVVLQHTKAETAGRLGEILRDYGHRLRVVELFAGARVPSDLDDVDGIISLGGPMNVDQADEHPWMKAEMKLIAQAHSVHIPVVGICLGAQLIAATLGGEVGPMQTPEVGWGQVKEAFPGQMDPMFAGLPWTSWQVHWHGQEVKKLPDGGTPLSGSKLCKTQAFKVGMTTFAFQYHFEWTKAMIQAVAADDKALLEKAGTNAAAIAEGTQAHYDMFRHLGDRLCENLADLLLPIDKRVLSRPGEPVENYTPAKS